jgi:hypothetical protein
VGTEEVELRAALDIFINSAIILANDEVKVTSHGGSILGDPVAGPVLMVLTISAGSEVEMRAAGIIDVSSAVIRAGEEIQLWADGDIVVERATLEALEEIEVWSRGGSIFAALSVFGNPAAGTEEVELTAAGDIDITGWIVNAADVELKAGGTIIGP